MTDINTQWIDRGASLTEAARLLREGQLVAFPTETVYGLGANALMEDAVRSIYAAKGRPSDNPLIVHVAPGFDLDQIVRGVNEKGRKLMEAFWPGPLTLIFPKQDCIPYATTGGLDTVGLRMPDHPTALSLLSEAGVPVAAPSANTSGKPSPTTAEHVRKDMDGRIACIVDGGPCRVGLESTIVDMSSDTPMILRPGAITPGMLQKMVGEVRIDPAVEKGLAIAEGEHPRAPGMKYRHYAPKGKMTLVTGQDLSRAVYLSRKLKESVQKGLTTGLLASEELLQAVSALGIPEEVQIISLGHREHPETMASRLFAALRSFDDIGCERIFAEAFEEQGVRFAMMNRMRRAASGVIVNADQEEPE